MSIEMYGCKEDYCIKPPKLKKVITDDKLPNKCPFCNDGIYPQYLSHYTKETEAQFWFLCPTCYKTFIGYYNKNKLSNQYQFSNKTSKGNLLEIYIPEEIKEITNEFYNIYKEACQAYSLNLNKISGPSFRKAFEFLIKEYLINFQKVKKTEISKKDLFSCIKLLKKNEDIKTIANEIRWLGNNETHFENKIEEENEITLKKLKDLIEHTIYHFTSEIKAKNIKNSQKTL